MQKYISCIRYQCRNTSVVSGMDAEMHQLYRVWMLRYINCIRYGCRDTSVVSGMDAEALTRRSGMCHCQ